MHRFYFVQLVLLMLGVVAARTALAAPSSNSPGSHYTSTVPRSPGSLEGGAQPIYFEATFFPVYVNRTDTQSRTGDPGVATESGLGYDLRATLGYVLASQWMLGFTYDLYSLKTSRPDVPYGDNGLHQTTDKNEYGPTIGYLNNGWRALLTVFMGGSAQVRTQNYDYNGPTGDVTIKNIGLSGFQVSLGYTFLLSPNAELGPTAVYRSVAYTKQSKVNRLDPSADYAGTSLFTKSADNSLSPMLSLILRF